MAKIKTHKGTAKRFKITKSGKLQYTAPGFGHLKSKKDAVVKYRKNTDRYLDETMSKNLKKLLPGVKA